MIKVLIATGLYAPDIGGPATYTKLLEDDLPGRGFDLTVVPFLTVRSYPKILRHVVYGWKVWRASKQVDLVYALDPVSVGLPAMIVAKLRRKAFVIRLGGDYAWEQGRVRFGVKQTLDEFIVSISQQPIAVRLLFAIQSFVTKKAELVVTPSFYLKSIVEQWGVPSKRINVIYSTLFPLQPSIPKDTASNAGQQKNISIVTAGRLVPWKGIRSLIFVVSKLKIKYPEIKLSVIGDGPDEGELKTYVSELGVDDSIVFLGRQSKADLANTIAAADLFVLNTAYEGLSHQLLEVMDLGVPIVTTSVGGNPELLTDGDNARLVPFDDLQAIQSACESVLDSEIYAAKLVHAAKLRTKDFSRTKAIDQIAEALKEIYDRR